jgi:hypothetical protein
MSKPRAWILVTIAASAGVVAGLLLPRAWPLRTASGPGPTPGLSPTVLASQLDLKLLVEKAVSECVASAAPGGVSAFDPKTGVTGKHYAGLYQLKDPAKAAAVSTALQKEVEAAMEGKGAAIWNRGAGDTSMGDNTGMTYFERGYRLEGRAGTVHGWCAQRGEYVSVVLVFYEM